MSAYSHDGWREHYIGAPGYTNTRSSKNLHISRLLHFSLPRRYTRLVFAILISSVLLFSSNTGFFITRTIPTFGNTTESLFPYPRVRQISSDAKGGLPPLYEDYRRYEDLISEHGIQLRNDTPRYIFFANQAHGCGWGNILQDLVFNALLASEAKIGYVWDDYTWSKNGDYAEYNGKLIPSRIPISTMLAGHVLGLNPRPSEITTPPSISSRTYHNICPEHERIVIHKDLVISYLHEAYSSLDLATASGGEILDAWVSYLKQPELENARCIEIEEDTPAVFDIWLFGSTRLQSLWGRLSRSPILENWTWSPLIRDAFERNANYFTPRKRVVDVPRKGFIKPIWMHFRSAEGYINKSGDRKEDDEVSLDKNITDSVRIFELLNDSVSLQILVLHLRRGDFKEHCANLAEWNSTYTGFSSFPHFRVRDKFDTPRIRAIETSYPNIDAAKEGFNDASSQDDIPVTYSMDEIKRIYAQHCFPDVRQIVRRVREIVRDYTQYQKSTLDRTKSSWWLWNWNVKGNMSGGFRPLNSKEWLKKVYIMTNGDPQWLAEVKSALSEDAKHSPKLDENKEFDWENIYTSRDLDLGWEEKPVAQALDVYIAQRADLFIGNGFSSLTSNVVMLRMQNKHFDPVQTRFW